MTDKICQMYEEEQVNKTRNGRKLVPDNIMPKLSWNLEKQEAPAQEDIQQLEGFDNQNKALQILFTIIIFTYTYILLAQDVVSQRIKTLTKIVRSTIGKIENFSRTSWTKIQENAQARLNHARTYRGKPRKSVVRVVRLPKRSYNIPINRFSKSENPIFFAKDRDPHGKCRHN